MGFNYNCDFNLQDCMKTLGVNERGRVQQVVTDEVLKLSDDYVPFEEGMLKASGHIENQTDVVWNTPYARYMWNGLYMKILICIAPDLKQRTDGAPEKKLRKSILIR